MREWDRGQRAGVGPPAVPPSRPWAGASRAAAAAAAAARTGAKGDAAAALLAGVAAGAPGLRFLCLCRPKLLRALVQVEKTGDAAE